MIKSIGTDLVEVARIQSDLDKYGERFIQRILGVRELEIFKLRADKPIFLSGRFAAKEAVIKGLGAFMTKRPPLNQIEIINDKSGRPELLLPSKIKTKLNGACCHLSITHDKNYAMAVALFEEQK